MKEIIINWYNSCVVIVKGFFVYVLELEPMYTCDLVENVAEENVRMLDVIHELNEEIDTLRIQLSKVNLI